MLLRPFPETCNSFGVSPSVQFLHCFSRCCGSHFLGIFSSSFDAFFIFLWIIFPWRLEALKLNLADWFVDCGIFPEERVVLRVFVPLDSSYESRATRLCFFSLEFSAFVLLLYYSPRRCLSHFPGIFPRRLILSSPFCGIFPSRLQVERCLKRFVDCLIPTSRKKTLPPGWLSGFLAVQLSVPQQL